MTQQQRRSKKQYPPNQKVLLVEGVVEERLIPYLIEKSGVEWPDDWRNAPVQIREKDGVENILKRSTIEAEVRESERRITGILLDADDDVAAKWASIRSCCDPYFPMLHKTETGSAGVIVSDAESGQKLGIWIMPDNQSGGMLETLLLTLVPGGESEALLKFARDTCREAKQKFAAPYKDRHIQKAEIHTWLAWQDEPGQQLHAAIDQQILDPKSEYAKPFVTWFCKLFEI